MALTELGSRLALIIDAKTDGAVTNIRKLAVEEKAAADQAEVLKARIADLEARSVRNPASKTTGLQLSRARNELAGLESSLASGVTPAAGKAERALSKLGLAGKVSGSAIVGGIESAGVAVAAFAGFEFLKTGIDDYIGLAQAVRQFQQASGASAEDASKLVGISQALGVSSSAAALGVFRLGKQVALAPQNFAQYGIAIAKNKDGTTNLVGTLENVATAYQHTGDAAQRNAIVYEAFGRAGTTLLPILNANKSTLEELVAQEQKRGHIFDQSEVDQAYQFQIATRELKDSLNALAVDAAKYVVPVLNDLVTTSSKVIDTFDSLAHNSVVGKIFGVAKYSPLDPLAPYFAVKKVVGLFGGGGGSGQSAQAKAQAEQAQADVQAQTQAFQQQVLSSLAGPFDVLAGPAAVTAANQTLHSALQSVKDAERSKAAAVRELAKARQGSPVATEASLTAAQARVTAAEAALRKARYVGGDAGVTSAEASLKSAQAAVNRLRHQGGVDTNTLANAEDRLKRASEAVTKAQHAAAKAQKAQNDAHGLSAKEILQRVTGEAGDQAKILKANERLASQGVSQAAIANLNTLNSQIPGTLVKVAGQMTVGLAKEIDRQTSRIDTTKSLISSVAGDPRQFYKAGEDRRRSFDSGFTHDGLRGLLADGLPAGGRSKVTVPSGPGGLVGGITIGSLHLTTQRGSELDRQLRREARKKALSTGGSLRGPQ